MARPAGGVYLLGVFLLWSAFTVMDNQARYDPVSSLRSSDEDLVFDELLNEVSNATSSRIHLKSGDAGGGAPSATKPVQVTVAPSAQRQPDVTEQPEPEPEPVTRPAWTPRPVVVSRCGQGKATCMNGQCIPRTGLCDGITDCSDMSDEKNCGNKCEPTEIRCNNGKCVQKIWVCDGENDCGDDTDEQDCATAAPGSQCSPNQFLCETGNQCYPKNFQCDGTNDCQDGSDEIGCAGPTIVKPPVDSLQPRLGETVTITCEAVGFPIPLISWRLNWGNVPEPPRVTATSEAGVGTLTIRDFQESDQGAYSCEAINNQNAVIATPDCIVTLEGTVSEICRAPVFNAAARTAADCISCYCSGVTQNCRSCSLHLSDISPASAPGLVDANGSPISGPRIRQDPSKQEHIIENVPELLQYGTPTWALPTEFVGDRVTSYGSALSYSIKYSPGGQPTSDPDVVIGDTRGTVLYYRSPDTPQPDVYVTYSVPLIESSWSKRPDAQQPPASIDVVTREDMMKVLQDLEYIRVRVLYDELAQSSSISAIKLGTAVSEDTGRGLATKVEQCICPPGYDGLSCERCAPSYEREGDRCNEPQPVQLEPVEQPTARPEPDREPECDVSGSIYPHPDPRTGQCVCKENTEGARCDQCKAGAFHLNPVSVGGCDLCFCSGVTQTCRGSNYYKDQIRMPARSALLDGLVLTNLERTVFHTEYVVYSAADNLVVLRQPISNGALYWQLPHTLLGDRVTSYGGDIAVDLRVQQNEENGRQMPVHFQIFGNGIFLNYNSTQELAPGQITTVRAPLAERVWFRDDGEPVTREHLLMALADLEFILVKAASVPNDNLMGLGDTSMQIAQPRYNAQERTNAVELCTCPPGYRGSSCEDCDRGYSRSEGGLYLGICEPCDCNGHSEDCDPESGVCQNCRDGTTGRHCEVQGSPAFGPDLQQPSRERPQVDVRAGTAVSEVTAGDFVTLTCDVRSQEPVRVVWSRADRRPVSIDSIQGGDHSLILPRIRLEDGGVYSCTATVEGSDVSSSGHTRVMVQAPRAQTRRPSPQPVKQPTARPVPFREPQCDVSGSIYLHPDPRTGQCVCKENTEGARCDQCKAGAFHLNPVSDGGCDLCFCSGVTQTCRDSNYYKDQIRMPARSALQDGLGLTNLERTVFHTEYVVYSAADNLVVLRQPISNGALYWQLPHTLLGDRVTSYGGDIAVDLRVQQNEENGRQMPVHFQIFGNGIFLNYNSTQELAPGQITTVRAPLAERVWFRDDGEPVTREHLLMALADLEFILVKAASVPNDNLMGLGDTSMQIAQPRYNAQERTNAVELCTCPPGYRGSSCEDCDRGYSRSEGGLYLGICEPCDCNGHSEDCDPESGVCQNCRDGTTGRHCEVQGRPSARPVEQPTVRPVPSREPECDVSGSIYPYPDPRTGQCVCKENTEGARCDQCKAGAFHLNPVSDGGCDLCFCSGVTQTCRDSNYYKDQIRMPARSALQDGLGLTNLERTVFHTEYVVYSAADNLVVLRQPISNGALYWQLPHTLLGDRVTSYGGDIAVDLRVQQNEENGRQMPVHFQIFGNGIFLNYNSTQELAPGQITTVRAPLAERVWFRDDGEPVTREHLLMALADLEFILVKAASVPNDNLMGLGDTSMQIAQPRYNAQERTNAVELCTCPPGYRGSSCEDCDRGYSRSEGGLYLGICEPCDCNGHSEDCDPESGVCQNCRDGTTGRHCEVQGRPSARPVEQPTVRPVPSREPECDVSGSIYPYPDPRTGQCVCKENTEGARCDQCKAGAFHLNPVSVGGCDLCFCSGVTQTCRGSNYYKDQIRMPARSALLDGLVLTNLERTVFHTEYVVYSAADNLVVLRQPISNGALYWQLPHTLLGDRVTSYGGDIAVDLRVQQNEENGRQMPVHFQIFGNGIFLNYNSTQELAPGQITTVRAPLAERVWFRDDGEPVTREHLLMALADLEFILVKAASVPNDNLMGLGDTSMQIAQPRYNAQERTNAVELCTCPPGYRGSSCEDCDRGYSRSEGGLYLGICEPCDCNGHSEDCDPESGVCQNCRDGTTGRHCEVQGSPAFGPDLQQPSRERPQVDVRAGTAVSEVTAGDFVTLTCDVRSQEPVRVVWSRADRRPVPIDSIQGGDHSLTLPRIRLEDGGVYTCTATVEGSDVSSSGHTRIMVQPPRAQTRRPFVRPVQTPAPAPWVGRSLFVEVSPPRAKTVQVGATVQFQCIVRSPITYTAAWTKVNGVLPSRDSDVAGVLTIHNAQPRDSGTYVCTGSNVHQTASDSAQLIVEGRPSIPERERPIGRPDASATQRPGGWTQPEARIEPYFLTVNEGEPVEFRCIATGNPTPRVSWQKGIDRVESPAVVQNEVLRISSARPEDASEYACTASSPAGTILARTVLYVTRAEGLPEVRVDAPEVRARPGESVQLRCYGSGEPVPDITWSRTDGPLPSASIEQDGILSIDGISEPDQGVYVCTGRNAKGSSRAEVRVLTTGGERPLPPTIQPLPEYGFTLPSEQRPDSGNIRLDGTAPTATIDQSAVTSYEGATVELVCTVTGDPAPSVRWYRHGGETDERHKSDNTKYTISSVRGDDRGIYVCAAENAAGSVQASAMVEIESPVYFSKTVFSTEKPSRCINGVCGAGRCVDTESSFECICPWGKTGAKCTEDIQINVPSYSGKSFSAYATPQNALTKLDLDLVFKARSNADGIILYVGANDTGLEDFFALVIKNRTLELRLDVGSGHALLRSMVEIQLDSWYRIHVERSNQQAQMTINDQENIYGTAPGSLTGLNLNTSLYIGGVSSRVKVASGVQVQGGLDGCVSKVEINGVAYSLTDQASVLDSANVGDCGDAAVCSTQPCRNGGVCSERGGSQYLCTCADGYTGTNCESEENTCSKLQPCLNGGTCTGNGTSYNCDCPLGHGGSNCEAALVIQQSISLKGNGHVEFNGSMLPHSGANEADSVTLSFKTSSPDGLLFWQGQRAVGGNNRDFLSLALKNGALVFSYELGSGPAKISSENQRFDDDQWHKVTLKRVAQAGTLSVDDDQYKYNGQARGSLKQLDTTGNIFLGGVPEMTQATGKLHDKGWSGCIKDLEIRASGVLNIQERAVSGRNVDVCAA